MDRIYTNHRHGERRIHIEIDEHEVADLLNDLAPGPDAFPATLHLIELLRESHDRFTTGQQRDAAETEPPGLEALTGEPVSNLTD
ncbi:MULTISPECIES: hypothetical protein [Streptomyces]|uniref:hypothetical protein n=1 Tax=Streptomyces TaxID=1883 RepID=UPI0004CD031A|nr:MULTISPECIES: hypothetical protein [Streptomyces]KOT57086.1 hypothetical protein ADK43_21915 [Streptomyces rimosus subsp. rimosus]